MKQEEPIEDTEVDARFSNYLKSSSMRVKKKMNEKRKVKPKLKNPSNAS
jgi:hypothetical protein